MLSILLISFVISNMIAERIIERKVTASVNTILLQVEEKMDSFYSDMQGISESLLYSPTVQTYMGTKDILSRILMNNEIISVFSNTITLKENIKGIQLYDNKGEKLASNGLGTNVPSQFPSQKMEYSGIQLNQSFAEPNFYYYTISLPIFNLKSDLLRDYLGACVFVMNVDNFSRILHSSKITNNSRLLLIDRNNKIMSSEGNSNQLDSVDIGKWKNDKRYIVQTAELPRTGWKLISVIPRDELLQELNIVQRLNVATYVVLLGLLSLFLLIFSTRILKPIKALMDFMKSFPKTEGQSRFNVEYHNEIGVLAANLNKMLDEVEVLSQEVLAKKQMEVLAFRNQINPHFLYNTLECIGAIASYYKVPEVADLSTTLSNMFRYSVKGGDFVTVEEELSHIKEYAKIIDLRFMGRIQISVEADECLLKVKTLKMLLQPIVENAVFHGVEKKMGGGIVQIRVEPLQRSKIQYLIQDNGYGMDESQLQVLLRRLGQPDKSVSSDKEDGIGIGLSNINRRIKLFYGDEAEMTIQSTLHQGTTVCVIVPAHFEERQQEGE
jgi:two-component system sensor histidine kinase YesM